MIFHEFPIGLPRAMVPPQDREHGKVFTTMQEIHLLACNPWKMFLSILEVSEDGFPMDLGSLGVPC